MDKKYPKVLVVSINAWRDNTGINTLIDFFKNWDKNSLAQVYTRSALPSTSVCDNFFRISENAVIKSLLNRKVKTGEITTNEEKNEEKSAESKAEQNLYNSKRKLSLLLSFCREIVWKFGRWKTNELDEFIKDFAPDVLFLPIYPTIYMGRLQKYIMKKTGKPVVSYIADDNYSYKSVGKNPIALLSRMFLRKYVKYIVKNSSKLLVIAPKQKEEYDRIFGVDSQVLTKGIDFSEIPFEEKELNNPIKLVYTGKLIIGRWKSLAAIAEALAKINEKGIKAELDIYTTDTLTKEQEKVLNLGGSCVKGALTLEEVGQVQKNADVLVFVESLEKKYKNAARLSFSTKITDYLKNGKCILAIGDKDIAPIDYFNRFDSAVTASSYEEIKEKLVWLIENPEKIAEYSKKGYDCGVENHNKDKMDKILINAIKGAERT